VLCGTSGAGKSALAAALAQRGHAVLADAVTVIAGGPDASPSVAPVAPEPLLWPDTAEELGLTRRESRLVRPALAKRAYALGAAPEAAPVAAVVVIQADAIRTEPELAPVVGGEKVESLLRSRWLGRLAEPLGLEPVQFLVATRVAAACSCARLVRPRAGAPVSALAALVEGLAA
jgi:hypothetical protein